VNEKGAHPSRGMGSQQQVRRCQAGLRKRPCKFVATAPGPPTQAKHNDIKLYITHASYLQHHFSIANCNIKTRHLPLYWNSKMHFFLLNWISKYAFSYWIETARCHFRTQHMKPKEKIFNYNCHRR
jgi:hypothetical protein